MTGTATTTTAAEIRPNDTAMIADTRMASARDATRAGNTIRWTTGRRTGAKQHGVMNAGWGRLSSISAAIRKATRAGLKRGIVKWPAAGAMGITTAMTAGATRAGGPDMIRTRPTSLPASATTTDGPQR